MKNNALLFASALLFGCTAMQPTPPPQAQHAGEESRAVELKDLYAGLGRAGGRVFALAPGKSAVRIHVFRGGRAARFGHNHVVTAPRFIGYFYLPPENAASGRFDLEFRLDELEFDKPEDRAALGPAFSSPLAAKDIEATREHMLGPDNMQADRFPFVRVRSLQIVGEAPVFAVRTEIELHGRKRELWMPLRVTGVPNALSVSGSFVLRQSDFGVQPYSALGGLLAVQDELVIEFTLRGAWSRSGARPAP